MTQHLHISAMAAVVFGLYLIVVGFFLRTVQMTWPDSALGKALAYVY